MRTLLIAALCFLALAACSRDATERFDTASDTAPPVADTSTTNMTTTMAGTSETAPIAATGTSVVTPTHTSSTIVTPTTTTASVSTPTETSATVVTTTTRKQ